MAILLPSQRAVALLLLCLGVTTQRHASAFTAFLPTRSTVSPLLIDQSVTQCWAVKKGGGGSKTRSVGAGFGATSRADKAKPPSKKSVVKKVQQKYGGTSAQEIARRTQIQIEKEMMELPPHLQMATQLYQKIQTWEAQLATMPILQQASIPDSEMEGAKRARQELERMCNEHNFTENNLHNVFQKITWDASADAKAARSITGQMPREIAARVEGACKVVAEAVAKSTSSNGGRCLDVGCGFGVLVPDLVKAGLSADKIYGMDLSPEMIRNAETLHPAAHFYSDMEATLRKAVSLLRPNGKLVIFHAQGASHVQKQVRANPVLVRRGLPDAKELRALDMGLDLLVEPAPPSSVAESKEGYLAVLQRT